MVGNSRGCVEHEFLEKMAESRLEYDLHSRRHRLPLGDSQNSSNADIVEKMCRYCFEANGDMISPCACAGGQRWVHFDCLLRWQRSVIEGQSTLLAFNDQDERLDVCNVCKSRYSYASPNLLEILASFTGPEFVDFIDSGYIIASHPDFSRKLERQLSQLPVSMHPMTRYYHFINAAYIIVDVSDDFTEEFNFERQEELVTFKQKLYPGLELKERGRTCVLTNEGSLSHVRNSVYELRQGLLALSVPATLVLHCVVSADDWGSDLITAVNLARPSTGAHLQRQQTVVDDATKRFVEENGVQPRAQVMHYIGGPSNPEELLWCIIPCGCNYTIANNLDEALKLAHTMAEESKGVNSSLCFPLEAADPEYFHGQQVRLAGLQSRKDLNGANGTIFQFVPPPDGGEVTHGRWIVKVAGTSDDEVSVRTENLLRQEPCQFQNATQPKVPVLVFWGDARWSRVELLDEIARGIWGLCGARREDLLRTPEKILAGCKDRLVFAARSSRTEPYITRGDATEQQMTEQNLQNQQRLQRQMVAHRQVLRRREQHTLSADQQEENGIFCGNCGKQHRFDKSDHSYAMMYYHDYQGILPPDSNSEQNHLFALQTCGDFISILAVACVALALISFKRSHIFQKPCWAAQEPLMHI